MSFTDFRGQVWDIARPRDMAWPTSTGGSTAGPCLIQDITKSAYTARGEAPDAQTVFEELKARRAELSACWHHRLPKAQALYVAELSCWFVEQQIEPDSQAVQAVVRRDGYPIDIAYAVRAIFEEPIRWTFAPGSQVENGRHRTCALKAKGIPRVAVVRVG